MTHEAIRNIHPNALTINGEFPDCVVCDQNGNEVVLNKDQIYDEISRLQLEFNSKEYQRQRVSEYPSIGDQLDDLYHSGAFSEEMRAKIQAIKDKYPKGQ